MSAEREPKHPRRPPRLHLLLASVDPFYFVTFKTYKRLPILARDEVHQTFRAFCARAEEHNVAVGRYVIMPDHVLRSSESYSEKWDYVQMNPVRAELCREPEEWPYQGEIVSVRW